MKAVRYACTIAVLALSLPAVALAAHPARTGHAVLHPAGSFQHSTMAMHVMASAKLKYVGADVTITLTADNLPAPRTLGAKAYVLFATDGGMTERVGTLMAHGAMASASGMVMMTKVQDLYVYAEPHPNRKRPNGKKVLAGMVM